MARIDRSKTFDSFERLVAIGTAGEGTRNRVEFRSIQTDYSSATAAGAGAVSEPVSGVLASVALPSFAKAGADVTALHWLSPTALLAATGAGDVHLLTVAVTSSSSDSSNNSSSNGYDGDDGAGDEFGSSTPSLAVEVTVSRTYARVHGGAGITALHANAAGDVVVTAAEDGTLALILLSATAANNNNNSSSSSASASSSVSMGLAGYDGVLAIFGHTTVAPVPTINNNYAHANATVTDDRTGRVIVTTQAPAQIGRAHV